MSIPHRPAVTAGPALPPPPDLPRGVTVPVGDLLLTTPRRQPGRWIVARGGISEHVSWSEGRDVRACARWLGIPEGELRAAHAAAVASLLTPPP
jgi:hypothetical protein